MTKLVFKGAVHYSQWIKFVVVAALVAIAMFNTDFNTRGSFIVVPGLLLMNLISKYRAKLIIENGNVTISQFNNRHVFDLSTIRKIEKD